MIQSSSTGRKCDSCYGSGELATESGPARCPDCGGNGVLPSHDVLVEWRCREIERLYEKREDEVGSDTRWLIFELRRSRHALIQILSLMQDASDDDTTAVRVRFLANEALGLYEPMEEPATEPAKRE